MTLAQTDRNEPAVTIEKYRRVDPNDIAIKKPLSFTYISRRRETD